MNDKYFNVLCYITIQHDHRPGVNGTPVAGNQELPARRPLTVKRKATFGLVIT